MKKQKEASDPSIIVSPGDIGRVRLGYSNQNKVRQWVCEGKPRKYRPNSFLASGGRIELSRQYW